MSSCSPVVLGISQQVELSKTFRSGFKGKVGVFNCTTLFITPVDWCPGLLVLQCSVAQCSIVYCSVTKAKVFLGLSPKCQFSGYFRQNQISLVQFVISSERRPLPPLYLGLSSKETQDFCDPHSQEQQEQSLEVVELTLTLTTLAAATILLLTLRVIILRSETTKLMMV